MREFGVLLGCAEMGVAPKDFPFVDGLAQALTGEESEKVGRLLVKAARDVMCATGHGKEAPSFHLHFVYKSADWNTHCQEVADHVAQVLTVLHPLEKKASSMAGNLAAGAGLGLKGVGYGALGAGGGLGALYWLLSRHATQDDADSASMQHQIDYYNNLSRELSDSMKRKYQYDQESQPPARKARSY
jgi:hypothetical protein